MQVLKYQPDHEEALKNLGMTWHAGQLLTHDEVAQAKEAKQRFLNTKRRWEPVVTRWSKVSDKPALREELERQLGGISDSAEMAALDEVLQDRCRTAKDPAAYRALSLEVVDVLGAMPKQPATESLVRHAVFHPAEEVRAAAIEPLKSRPMYTFVPMLLSGMATLIEGEFYVSHRPGRMHESGYRLYREGLQADWTAAYDGRIVEVVAGHGRKVIRTLPLAFLVRQQQAAEQRLAAVQASVEANNAVLARRNERIAQVLAEVTGVAFGANPLDWWNWWLDHTQREVGRYPAYSTDSPDYQTGEPGKPVYEVRAYRRYTAVVGKAVSCFAKGTQVWTLAGITPIEEIRVGDRVLSQDPGTGELAYKPVLETTLRRPTERIRISLPNETIHATGGHPFWVSGQGWRMAGELDGGVPLHGVSGAVAVEKVERVEPDQAWYDFSHNLIVADFGTYFVGKPGILVHDNTPERPTDALVPGLMAP
jgi:hypothetical protein